MVFQLRPGTPRKEIKSKHLIFNNKYTTFNSTTHHHHTSKDPSLLLQSEIWVEDFHRIASSTPHTHLTSHLSYISCSARPTHGLGLRFILGLDNPVAKTSLTAPDTWNRKLAKRKSNTPTLHSIQCRVSLFHLATAGN